MKGVATRVGARDITEEHRVSSSLELLFDLTFVVAIGSLVAQLAHAIGTDHAAESIGPFFMVFFAVWWAWNQFTWLASAYDSDDFAYRILTLVQMAGVLVLAAGVPSAFENGNFLAGTIGYLIMRVGLVGNLVRVWVLDPESRPSTQRYIIGISVVQLGWLLSLALAQPGSVVPWFLVLAAAELLVSPWADRAQPLPWHPHHIAERYGLFTIILLGESVLAVTLAVQVGVADGVTVPLVGVAASGLVLLFSLWWLYFLEPAADGLVKHRNRSYLWRYGHYFLYASLAAIGAGFEVAVAAITQHLQASDMAVGFGVAIPVASFLMLLWLLHIPIVDQVVIPPVATIIAAALILVMPIAAPAVGLLAVAIAITLVTAGLLGVALSTQRTAARADESLPEGRRGPSIS